MNFPQLQYFYEIGVCGSFTEAAKRLHVTQPSLSKAVSALEAETGCQLFYRTKSGVQLTECGEAFFAQTGVVLREFDKLSNMNCAKSSLAVGIPPTMGHCFIPEVMKISQRALQGAIIWKEVGTALLEKALKCGTIDAAFLPLPIVENMEQFDYVPFTSVEEQLYVSEKHPLAGEKAITRKMVESETFVLFSQDYNQNVPFARLFDNSGFNPTKVTYTSQLSTALEMIEKIWLCQFLLMRSAKERIQNTIFRPFLSLRLSGWNWCWPGARANAPKN